MSALYSDANVVVTRVCVENVSCQRTSASDDSVETRETTEAFFEETMSKKKLHCDMCFWDYIFPIHSGR